MLFDNSHAFVFKRQLVMHTAYRRGLVDYAYIIYIAVEK